MKKALIIIAMAVVLMATAYSQMVGNKQPQIPAEIVETPIETPVETVVEVETPEEKVESPKEVIIVEPVKEDLLPIDPDTIPKNGFITYREIRDGIDKFYKSLIENGYSKEAAMVEITDAAKYDGTTIDELNRLVGYNPIGETTPVAVKPTAPTGENTTPNTPTTPIKPTTPDKEPAEPTQPSGKISQYGYEITDWDKNGNGINDGIEDNYANTDGTVSLPEGTENPFEMP